MSRDVKTPGESVAGVSSVQESRLERDVLAIVRMRSEVGGESNAALRRWPDGREPRQAAHGCGLARQPGRGCDGRRAGAGVGLSKRPPSPPAIGPRLKSSPRCCGRRAVRCGHGRGWPRGAGGR